MEAEGHNKGRTARNRRDDNPDEEFKSKNLDSERKRRKKLSYRLLKLRALVPIITNMTTAAILEDSANYIRELQKLERGLLDQLEDGEAASCALELEPKVEEINGAVEEMKKVGIEENVKVTHVGDDKLWVTMILQKKRGRLTRLMESMRVLGFEFTNISITTHSGAVLITSFVERVYGVKLADQETRELLLKRFIEACRN